MIWIIVVVVETVKEKKVEIYFDREREGIRDRDGDILKVELILFWMWEKREVKDDCKIFWVEFFEIWSYDLLRRFFWLGWWCKGGGKDWIEMIIYY